jgi:hypothetical protein
VPHSTIRAGGAARWLLLLGALALAWLTTSQPVPLYDGIGFPDEPYRFVPARGSGPAATSAVVQLKVAGGSNTGGLIANSSELGPQVSMFAPPHAFAAPGTASIVLAVRPVPATGPLPDGVLESNVYAVSLTSAAGAVTILPEAQPPALTMRSVTTQLPEPVFMHRAAPGERWRELKTRRVGTDIYNTTAPGVGEYVLVRDAAAPQKKATSAGRGPLYAVVGATVVLMVLVLAGVRVLARKATPP